MGMGGIGKSVGVVIKGGKSINSVLGRGVGGWRRLKRERVKEGEEEVEEGGGAVKAR